MNKQKLAQLEILFAAWAGGIPTEITPLPKHGSDREYVRLKGEGKTALGAWNQDKKENKAFIAFSKHFRSKGLPVPEILGENEEAAVYLVEDLGNTTLLGLLTQTRTGEAIPAEIKSLYRESVAQLAELQIRGGEGLDYSLCYPRPAFDAQSMQWDLQYFKYYFLKLAKVHFEEQALENDFQALIAFLLTADSDFFLFRDFQGRNIMIHEGAPRFIDYQGGRKGALQYDLASLLFQAKANLSAEFREELVDHYLSAANQLTKIEATQFRRHFYGFVLMRLLQTLGAYGFRGFYERRSHFLHSIPFALKNVQWLLQETEVLAQFPALLSVFEQMLASDMAERFTHVRHDRLTVRVTSFSYKLGGIPTDLSGNGGGFVFDCRALHNPGRYAPYKTINGRTPEVKAFLEEKSRIADFLEDVYGLVDPAVENYLERGFTDLMVNFGCTGGMHRSVYSADRLTEHLQQKYGVAVDLKHIEQGIHEWFPATASPDI